MCTIYIYIRIYVYEHAPSETSHEIDLDSVSQIVHYSGCNVLVMITNVKLQLDVHRYACCIHSTGSN